MSFEQDPRPISGPEDHFTSQYGEGPQKVEARFRLYDFLRPPFDVETKILESIGLLGSETWVDVGTANGQFLKLIESCGHQGDLIGVEPNTGQFNHALRWEPINPDPVIEKLESVLGHTAAALIAEDYSSETSSSKRIKLLKGTADSLPVETSSAHVVSVKGVMYHVPERKQDKAFQEFQRVLRPDGLFILTTTGMENKINHRKFEQKIANYMPVKTRAPDLMNAGFNSQRASNVLPRRFSNVKMLRNASEIVINSEVRLEAYLNSLRSLRDQFDPIMDENTFEEALDYVVVPEIEHDINKYGEFVDLASHSISVCSRQPLNLHDPDNRFETLAETS